MGNESMRRPKGPNQLTVTQKGNTAHVNLGKGLNRKEYRELVNLLRKNMLYQTPKPVFADQGDEQPTWVDLRFVFAHQQRILQLIHKHGGWVMPPDEKKKLLQKHEEAARVAYGDGVDYDLSHLTYGDMVAMHEELKHIDEMVDFRKALAEAIADHQEVSNA